MRSQGLGERADRFFDHRLQLRQAMGFLFGRDKKFEVEFMDDVVGDLPREIDRCVAEVAGGACSICVAT